MPAYDVSHLMVIQEMEDELNTLQGWYMLKKEFWIM